MEKPYSNCLKNLETDDSNLKRYFNYFNDLGVDYYDQNFCYKICAQDLLLNQCGCVDITTPAINNASYCESDSELKCLSSFQAYSKTADLSSICKCPIQCEMVEYDLKTSSANFPTATYLQNLYTDEKTARFFPPNMTSEQLVAFSYAAFLKLTINYDNLYYTLYEDKPAKTLDAIIGEIGGQLGLCGGISLLNACEFIGILVSCCYRHSRHRKEVIARKQSKTNSEKTSPIEITETSKNNAAPKLVKIEFCAEI